MKKSDITLYLELSDVTVGLGSDSPNKNRDLRAHATELIDKAVERNDIVNEKSGELKKLADKEWSDSSLSWNISGIGHLHRYISMSYDDGDDGKVEKRFGEIDISLGSAITPPMDKIEGTLYYHREEWEARKNLPDRPSILFSISKATLKRLCNEILSKQITGVSLQIQVIGAIQEDHVGAFGPPDSTDFIYIDGNECQVSLESISLSKRAGWIKKTEDEDQVFASNKQDMYKDDMHETFPTLISKQTEMIGQVNKELKALRTIGVWTFCALITLIFGMLLK
jgi:hypothetical protein